MVRSFKPEDKDKPVMTADGTEIIGTVESVTETSIQVTPDENLTQNTRRRLGWSQGGTESYELKHGKVEKITDDEIRLSEEH